jgi:hypothetical protein
MTDPNGVFQAMKRTGDPQFAELDAEARELEVKIALLRRENELVLASLGLGPEPAPRVAEP